jgi:negative regulator of sigma E activity
MTASPDPIAIDKLDTHYRQQLSALMDGGLAAEEARFLMRRLQHDRELTGCWERWQLCGDVLRGQATAPAPAGFAERIAQAVAAEAPLAAALNPGSRRSRSLLARWGGGALAASVALVALFMARQQAPQEAPAEGTLVAQQQAQTAPVPAAPQTPAPAVPDAEAYAAAAVAVASVPRRQDAAARRSATRNQQAARAARVARADAPARAVAGSPMVSAPASTALASSALVAPDNPFASRPPEAVPQARPWPRSTLSGYPAAGGLTTGYATDSARRTFYPFEPRLPASPPVAPPDDARQD